jgi:hypothetical protein
MRDAIARCCNFYLHFLENTIRQPASKMFSERVHRSKCHILHIRSYA